MSKCSPASHACSNLILTRSIIVCQLANKKTEAYLVLANYLVSVTQLMSEMICELRLA